MVTEAEEALALVVVAFAPSAVSLGVQLATIATTCSQASGMTTKYAMLTAALGGADWPLEITPPVYQTVVKVLSITWAMIEFNTVIVRGQGVPAVLFLVVVLLVLTVLYFTIGMRRLHFE